MNDGDVQSQLLAYLDDLKGQVLAGAVVGIVALAYDTEGGAMSWVNCPTIPLACVVGNVDMLKDQIKRPKLRPVAPAKANG